MMNIDELDEKFSIEGEVCFAELENDLIFLTVYNKHAQADICLYGAQVTTFTPHSTMEMLWMSEESNFEVGTPIRGGIPVCFPWFGVNKTNLELPAHGFARLMYWDVIETASQPLGETLVKLQLCSSDATKQFWNHDFCAEMTIIVGKTLSVSLKVTNTSKESFEYSAALHSYFSVSSIQDIAIEGLQNTAYIDQLLDKNGMQETALLEIKKAETRHYTDTTEACIIHDSAFRRKIRVEKSGSKITTVWNPGEETCANIGDMANDAYLDFICVEAVNAFNDTIKLASGESHELSTFFGIQ